MTVHQLHQASAAGQDDAAAMMADLAAEVAALGWQTAGLCNQVDPELWFPEKGGSTAEAKKICRACDVRYQCLTYALGRDERFGVWGGQSPRERRATLRALRRAESTPESPDREEPAPAVPDCEVDAA